MSVSCTNCSHLTKEELYLKLEYPFCEHYHQFLIESKGIWFLWLTKLNFINEYKMNSCNHFILESGSQVPAIDLKPITPTIPIEPTILQPIQKEKLAIITFSHDYPKLKQAKFSTIRRYDKDYEPGQIRLVRMQSKWLGKAKIILKHKKKLNELSDDFLAQDTNTKTRNDAINVLNSFYDNPIAQNEQLTVLFLGWVA